MQNADGKWKLGARGVQWRARIKFIKTKRLAKGSPTVSAETAERMGHREASLGIEGRPPAKFSITLS